MRKIVETRSSLSNTIKDTSTIMRNPSLHNSDKGVTHDCASILDSIAKETSCFHYFSHGASLHRHSFSRMIFTLVYSMIVTNSMCIVISGVGRTIPQCLQVHPFPLSYAAITSGYHFKALLIQNLLMTLLTYNQTKVCVYTSFY